MAPEDMRDDLIDNEPLDCVDDAGVEEKTWSWLVFRLSRRCPTRAELWSVSLKRGLMLFAGLCSSGGIPSERFVITTNASASVSEPTVKLSRCI